MTTSSARSSNVSSAARAGSGQIGMVAAVSIGVGGMVGAGIFSILGVVAHAAGNAMWLAFAIGGVVALLSTYSYAKLGAAFPSSGRRGAFPGERLWRRRSGRRAEPVHVGRLHHFACPLCHGFRRLRRNLPARSAVAAAAEVIGRRCGRTARPDQCFRSQAHGPLGDADRGNQGRDPRAVCRGRPVVHQAGLPFTRAVARRKSILFGAGVLFIGYEGFGLITNAAADMRNPSTMLPRALYTSVILVIALYLAVVAHRHR